MHINMRYRALFPFGVILLISAFCYVFLFPLSSNQLNQANQNVAKMQQINGIWLLLLLPCYHGFLRRNCCYFCWQRLDKTTNNSLEFACEMQSAKTKRKLKKRKIANAKREEKRWKNQRKFSQRWARDGRFYRQHEGTSQE